MGQYYRIVNIDKQQLLYPYTFNDGAKLLEFGCSSEGMLTALAILLADGNGRGGGDLHSEHPIIGSWAGDRIVVAGDYADDMKFINVGDAVKFKMLQDGITPTLYELANEYFEDVSEQVLTAMLDDRFIYETYEKTELHGKAKEVFDKAKMEKEKEKKKHKKAG